MHKDVYLILKIPFESKKVFLSKSNSKYEYQGNAYYLLNRKGEVLRDFMQLDTEKMVNYRINDNKMMIGVSGIGTIFWQKEGIKRKVILPKVSSVPFITTWTTKTEIDNLNKLAIESQCTVLSMDAFLTGSNSSGADADIRKTPILSVDTIFYGMRFVNPFKHYRKIKNNKNASSVYKITQKELAASSFISLEEYFKLFPTKKKIFYKYNPESYEMLYDEKEKINTDFYMDLFDNKKLKGQIQGYKDLSSSIIYKYNKDEINKKQLIRSLRGVLRGLLIAEYNLNKHSTLEHQQENPSNMDAAHLYDVRWLKNEKDSELWKIADINNGLLLPKNIHWKFDKEKGFTLKEDFKFYDKNGKFIDQVNEKYVNDKRKEYIKYRNQKLGY